MKRHGPCMMPKQFVIWKNRQVVWNQCKNGVFQCDQLEVNVSYEEGTDDTNR